MASEEPRLSKSFLTYMLFPPVGGVNTYHFSTELPRQKYEMLRNVEIATRYGIFASRKGYTAYNTSAIDSNPIRGGTRWYYGSTPTKELVVASGTQLWKGDDSAGTFSSIKTGLTTGKDVFFASYLDKLYIVNGADAVQRWDGTTMRAAGFPAPAAPALADGGAGSLTGDYKYKVTFIYDSNNAFESSASPASNTITLTNKKVTVTIPTGGAQSGVSGRRIYRTKNAGTDYFLLATISDNTTTTYTDDSAKATGSITCVSGANLVDGETFTLNDGVHNAVVFEFDSGGGVTAGRIAVAFTAGDSADTVKTTIIAAVNAAAQLDITAASGGSGIVNLTNDTAGSAGNQAITETVANAGFLVSGMSGGITGTDASLSSTQAPTDNGVPLSGAQFIVFWRGRMVLARTPAQPQRVFFSSITSTERSPDGSSTKHGSGPEIFPDLHWLDAGDNNSPVTGLAVLRDQLVIFKEDQVWTISADDARNMSPYAAEVGSGCIAPKTIVNMDGFLMFLGRHDGSPWVYKFDGARAIPASEEIEPTLRANIKSLGDLTNQAIQPCAGRYRNQYVLCYPKTGGTTFECAVYCQCPGEHRWVFWDTIEAAIFIPWNGRSDAGEMYFGSQQEGRVLRLDNGFTDYKTGTPAVVTSTVETAWLHLGYPNRYKQLHHIEVYAKAIAKGRLKVERRFDFNAAGIVSSVLDMSTVLPGRNIFKTRIDCGGSAQAAAATGTITVVTGSSLVDGETFTLNDGLNPAVVFEFDSGGGVGAGNVAVAFTAGDSATTVRDSVISAIQGAADLFLRAESGGSDSVNLTNEQGGTQGNQAITETVANGGFAVTGMSGGTDAEQCYLLKLLLTFYGSDTGIADHIEIFKVVLYFEDLGDLMYHTEGSGTGNSS